MLVLRDFRPDGLRQYVLAVSGKRVGVVIARKAKLTLKNTAELNAFVLSARTGERPATTSPRPSPTVRGSARTR